jgi:hypothetical protein
LIVGARMKGRNDEAAMIGWHTRNLHYVKKLPDLAKYLEPPPSPERKRETGNAATLAMFKRHAKKKGTRDGTR